MSDLSSTFDRLSAAGRKGLIAFVTAGDPSPDLSLAIIKELAASGADIIELGVPFSDPMADGPTIQRSSQRALQIGIRLSDILTLARDFRLSSAVPIVLFSYLNPLIAYGLEKLTADASAAGIDGVLITDTVDDGAELIGSRFRQANIDLISLIAPTTSEERLKRICERASGFIYAVSRAGVTGTRAESSTVAEELVVRARKYTDLPIAVGFGISTSDQIASVWQYADAVVVGSAIVKEIEKHAGCETLPKKIGSYLEGLLPSFAKPRMET